jgi:hypothetical protein
MRTSEEIDRAIERAQYEIAHPIDRVQPSVRTLYRTVYGTTCAHSMWVRTLAHPIQGREGGGLWEGTFMTAHRDPRRFHPGIIGTKNSPNPIRQSQFHFGAINWPICYQKKTARKNAAIEISAVFKMEAGLTKKRGRGRPRGSTNAKAKQRKMAVRRAQYAEIREIDRTIQLDKRATIGSDLM